MDDRVLSENTRPPHLERRQFCRRVVAAALAVPALTLAACANPRPDWKPNWRRGTTAKGGNRGRNGGGRR